MLFPVHFASYPVRLISNVFNCGRYSISELQAEEMMSVFRSFSLSLSNSPGTIYLHDGRRCRDVVCREGVLVKVSTVTLQPDRLIHGL